MPHLRGEELLERDVKGAAADRRVVRVNEGSEQHQRILPNMRRLLAAVTACKTTVKIQRSEQSQMLVGVSSWHVSIW